MKVLHSVTIAYEYGEASQAQRLAHRLMPDPEPEYKVEHIVHATSFQLGHVRYSWELDHVIPGRV